MSDTDNEKPKLGMRQPLGVKRTVETGVVKQSFSHGRSNNVVVEVKRARTLRRPGEPEPAAAAPAAATPPAPAPSTPAPQARAPEPRTSPVSPANSLLSRQELQAKLLREAEEARMTALEENRRRDERIRLDAIDEERRRAEERARAAEAPAPAPEPAPAPKPEPVVEAPAPAAAPVVEAPAAPEPVSAPTPAPAVAPAPVQAKAPVRAPVAPPAPPAPPPPPLTITLDSSLPAPRLFTPVPRPERPRPAPAPTPAPAAAAATPASTNTTAATPSGGLAPKRPGSEPPRPTQRDRKGDDRRTAGKLTVNRALGDGDGARARSLAALKRAREKEHRRMGGPREAQAKQVRDVQVPETITCRNSPTVWPRRARIWSRRCSRWACPSR